MSSVDPTLDQEIMNSIVARYPRKRSAIMPLLHYVQSVAGYVTNSGIENIAEILEKDGKGSATKILIAGGSGFGLKKGDKLKVVEVVDMEVNGKKLQRKKEIGELKVSKVDDESFSTCSVSSGGVDINSKFEAKSKILIMTKD